ncbi:hypothetical protein EAY03_02230 [Vibrio anguillarum]|uniref:Uncharacterized protein n=1 Tax=Vibrio anguillarum TaxID=55601 RepID=A0A289GFI4_VIBAN|nr:MULTISPECIES: hypothetical protein [Vibrio]ASW82300.1 hypothetical protein CK207_14875 [Vibrio anguillarum]AXN02926.1 hypothetical protein DD610_01130 [Vibrio anguillarum]AZS24869.1 hypothetical protein DYL72_07210 [Vibrio anguillarum]MBF4308725.1 hypothetical protein [Vibrio anguillarum]MBF4326789.1 hypothetical protein [Vibrio anguillarum]
MIKWFKVSAVTRLRFITTASLVVIGLSGCASNESITMVGEYAKQSTEVQDALIAVYESADDARINAELMKATRDGVTGSDLNISTINNAGQEALLKNLNTFSQSIYLLATDDRSEALDKYSEKLNSSLVSLSRMPQVGEIDVNDVELLSTSVNAIARAYTEKKRYDLLKKIVIDSENIVQSAFKSLEGELDSWKKATRISLEKELRIRLYLLNNPNRCETSDNIRCVTFYHSLEERADAYKKAYEIRVRINELDAKFAKLERALVDIQKLNQSIVISLKNDDDLTKDAAKKALKSTKTQIDAIKEFRDSLED